MDRAQLLSRYSRQAILPEIGISGQLQICKSSIAVVGAGGIGSTLLMYLAGAGVGNIHVIDDDLVDCSNLHRQIIHPSQRQGTSKAESAKMSMLALNPNINVKVSVARLTEANASSLLLGAQLLLDASDNFDTRYLLNRMAVQMQIPYISAAAVGWEGSLTVIIPRETACYECLYPEVSETEKCRDCSNSGVLGPVPGLVGCLEAMEALKLLVQINKNSNSGDNSNCSNDTNNTTSSSGSGGNESAVRLMANERSEDPACRNKSEELQPLTGRMMFIDGRTGNIHTFELPPRCENCRRCGTGERRTVVVEEERAPDYDFSVVEHIDTTAFADLYLKGAGGVVLDVRSPTQYGLVSLHRYYDPNATDSTNFVSKTEKKTIQMVEFHLPLAEIKTRARKLLSNKNSDPTKPLEKSDILQGLFGSHLPHVLEAWEKSGNKSIYMLCRRGMDSQRSFCEIQKLLSHSNSENAEDKIQICNIRGGLTAWAREVDPSFPMY